MKAVIQRVCHASVSVGGEKISSIGRGLLVLVCVVPGDDDSDIELMARKIGAMRIFDDSAGVMNLNVAQAGGELLAVSQFTLAASVRKGNRPSYIGAARPEEAIPLYGKFCEALAAASGCPVSRGRFGADMQVELVNDGPVTITVDTKNLT